MRRMLDSTNPFDIPPGEAMVAGYVDGLYAWSQEGWARFPNAVKVRIAVFSQTNDGHVADVESGDMTPAGAVQWVRMRRAAGVDPSVYCNLSTWPQVQQAFHAAGEPEPHYWIALWNGDQSIPVGAVAHQFADPPSTGGHYDMSSVLDYWPGVDGVQPAPTSQTEDDDMLYTTGFTALSAQLRVYTAGASYKDPAGSALQLGVLPTGAVVKVSGYCWSTSPVHSPNLGNGQPGADYLWWLIEGSTPAVWVPDAILDTTTLHPTPAPSLPAASALHLYFAAVGVQAPSDDTALVTRAELKSAVNSLPGHDDLTPYVRRDHLKALIDQV